MRKDRRTRQTIDGKSAPYRIKWTNPSPTKVNGQNIYPLMVVAVLCPIVGKLHLKYAGGQIGISEKGLVIPGYRYIAESYRTLVYHIGCLHGEHEEAAERLLVELNEHLQKGEFWMPPKAEPLTVLEVVPNFKK